MNLTTKRINLRRAFFSSAALVSMFGGMMSTDSAVAQKSTSTSTVCYFQKGNNTVWRWGLNSNFDWFKLNGKWVKNHQTKNYKFETRTPEEQIKKSCEHSQHYYQKRSYKLTAIYASDSRHGKNHPIYVNGKRISPSQW